MYMHKISVIIPMYNGEAFIGQCIRSVTAQTYRNLEILVVDDGSTDKGPEICEQLGASDGRIRLLRKGNGGVSSARNHGIDAAGGEYVFFLDCDDAVHPRLLEEMMRQLLASHAGLAFCGYRRIDGSRMDAALEEAWAGGRAQWLASDEAGTKEWFHVKYTDSFSGIGGKLILREAVGNLRFDHGLTNGEDTFFLYQLVKRGIRSVYCTGEWYCYRVHGESVTNSAGMAKGKRYFECARRIRDGEYESGNAEHAMRWEILAADQIRRNYAAQKRGKEKEALAGLKEIARAERRHPLFRRICPSDRLLFGCCFSCYPLYVVLNGLAHKLTEKRI